MARTELSRFAQVNARNECFAALRKALHKALPIDPSSNAWHRLQLTGAVDADTK